MINSIVEIYHIGGAKRYPRKRSTKGRRCGNKKKYYNKEAAFSVVRRMVKQQKRFKHLEVYRCDDCTEWATAYGTADRAARQCN